MEIYTVTGEEQQDPAASDYLLNLTKAELAKETERLRPLIFAYGRLKLVNAVLAYRHGGPCLTDDGLVYFDLMLPYSVEIARIRPEHGSNAAFRRFRHWMPKLLSEMGREGFGAQWDEHAERASIARSHNRSMPASGNVLYLPTAERIRDDLLLRCAEREAINALYPDRPPIRGVGVVDPPTDAEKRERDRLRKDGSTP